MKFFIKTKCQDTKLSTFGSLLYVLGAGVSLNKDTHDS